MSKFDAAHPLLQALWNFEDGQKLLAISFAKCKRSAVPDRIFYQSVIKAFLKSIKLSDALISPKCGEALKGSTPFIFCFASFSPLLKLLFYLFLFFCSFCFFVAPRIHKFWIPHRDEWQQDGGNVEKLDHTRWTGFESEETLVERIKAFFEDDPMFNCFHISLGSTTAASQMSAPRSDPNMGSFSTPMSTSSSMASNNASATYSTPISSSGSFDFVSFFTCNF